MELRPIPRTCGGLPLGRKAFPAAWLTPQRWKRTNFGKVKCKNAIPAIFTRFSTAVHTGTSRTYNGSTVDALTGTAALSGLVNNETLTLGGTTTGTLASANAGSEAVSTAVTLANGTGLASNYVLTQATLANVTIAQAPLTVTGTIGATNKVYDGTTTDPLTGGVLQGVIQGDAVTLIQTGNFASKNVRPGLAVTVADSLSGASAGNYTLSALEYCAPLRVDRWFQ
jgi:hypothetical protein